MRDLKFRAWDKRNNRFVYFQLFEGINSHTPEIYSKGKYLNDDFKEWQQFTGLKDKNGKEIYEGGIVRFFNEPETTREVSWSNAIGFTLGTGSIGLYAGELEVIGNIYENPELLTN
jgi:uncharacterized phage protein (TIGR01671 family)